MIQSRHDNFGARLARRSAVRLVLGLALIGACVLAAPREADAQSANATVDVSGEGPGEAQAAERRTQTRPLDPMNPVSILEHAARALPIEGREEVEPAPRQGVSSAISIMLVLTAVTLAPSLLVMCTCFTRIIIVLALLRQALGTQTLPPSQVILGLSLFLTLLVMAPTFEEINRVAIAPLQANEIDEFTAWERGKAPIRAFMFDQIEYADNWADVYMVLKYRGVDVSQPETLTRGDVDMLTLIPAFILSELKVAFLMGFRLYLPFLIIDMVIASVLISMGMIMLPPVLISLPFKLLMFVLVDGWQLVAGSLLNSFAVPGVTT